MVQSYSDEEVPPVVQEVLAANPQAVEGYKNGDGDAMEFLVDRAVEKSNGLRPVRAYIHISDVLGEFDPAQE